MLLIPLAVCLPAFCAVFVSVAAPSWWKPPLPLRIAPIGHLGPVLVTGASLQVSVAPGDGLVALPLCLGFPSSLCLVAAKASGPVWGFIPLHHVACADGVLCAPPLWYSSAYDPGPPMGLR